jgi:hypothetical protein
VADRKECGLNVSVTHDLEVTQQVVVPIEFDGKRASLVSLFEAYTAIAQQVQYKNRAEGSVADLTLSMSCCPFIVFETHPGIERSVTFTPIALRCGAVFLVWLPPIMTKCISFAPGSEKEWSLGRLSSGPRFA